MLLRYVLQKSNEKLKQNLYRPLSGTEHFVDSHLKT